MVPNNLKIGLIALIALSSLTVIYCSNPFSYKKIDFSVNIALLPNDLIVLEAKPVQVIYDAEALVKDKISVIYVVIQSTFSEIKYVNVELSYDFGIRKILDSGPDGAGIPIHPGINRIFVPGGPVVNETWRIIHDSWSASFIRWTQTGIDNKIKIILDPANQVEEADETNNEYVVEPVKIVDTRGLSILFIPACFEGEEPPSSLDVEGNASKSAYFLWATFPVAENEVKLGVRHSPYIHIPSRSDYYLDPLLIRLEMILMCHRIARLAKISGYDRGVGMVPTDWFINKGFSERGITHKTTQGCLVDHVYWTAVSHEMGHTFGLRTDKEEYLIAPNIYGFEASGFWVWNREIIPRSDEKSAYCFMGSITSYEVQKYYIDHPINKAGRWICNECYNKLLNNFKVCDPEVILISGFIYKNNTVMLDPIYRLQYGIPDLHETGMGNYEIVLLDDKDNILCEYWFNASFSEYFNENIELEFTPFLFTIPSHENVKQIQIKNATGQALITVRVSNNSPEVSLQTPRAGEIVRKGSIINITWTSDDPDEDVLTFSLLCSNDNGETWIPLATDITQNSYELDTKNFKLGNYLIKILATDGFNTAEIVLDQPILIEGVHDISISHIEFSKQYPCINETIFIYVTLQNKGDFTEIFDVNINYTQIFDPLIGTETVTLQPGEALVLNFTWIPDVAGRYEIKAYTSLIPDDINPYDNMKLVYIYVSIAYTSTSSTDQRMEIVNARGGRLRCMAYTL
ncbi:MAG: hypothetical protein QXF61_11350 [Nitrososphaeria archaeon]